MRHFISGFIVGAILALCAYSVAHAKQRATCNQFGVCVFEDVLSADPHIITIPPNVSTESQDRDAQWESFCQPHLIYGQNWMPTYAYAHEGCDMGRDH